MNLKQKTAIVTGGTRGIGREICVTLAKAGANIVFAYRLSGQAADELMAELEQLGVKAAGIQCDVADFEAAKALIDTAAQFGGVDILVNNAGVNEDGLLMRMNEKSFDRVVDTNLKGAFHCMRHAAPVMVRKRAGRIINISSVVGLRGNAGQVNYAASKAGIVGMTMAAAKELGSRGITVNAVAPGLIQTDMTEKLAENGGDELMTVGTGGTLGDNAGKNGGGDTTKEGE